MFALGLRSTTLISRYDLATSVDGLDRFRLTAVLHSYTQGTLVLKISSPEARNHVVHTDHMNFDHDHGLQSPARPFCARLFYGIAMSRDPDQAPSFMFPYVAY